MAGLRRKAFCLLGMKTLFHRHMSVAWASSTYKAVIFDMFGVLIPSPIHRLAEWEDENGVPRGTIGQAIRTGGDDNSWMKYNRGELGSEEFVEAFSQDCSQITGSKVHFGSFFLDSTNDTFFQPLPVMMEAVQCVRAEGFKTAVLTNNFLLPGGKSFFPLEPSLFDAIVESCRVGLMKPDLRIFQLCAERLGVLPEEAVFLDDLSFNVEAAVKVGMHGIMVQNPELAVKELEQVLKVPLSGSAPRTHSVKSMVQLPMEKLTQYVRKVIQPSHTDHITVRQFSHSHTPDSTYLLSCGKHRFVMKKKTNNEALRKECRLLKVLKEVRFPVPDVISQSEEPSVLGFPFYLSSYCQGRQFNDHYLPGLSPDERKGVYETMIKTLCKIHKVDLKKIGLEDLKDSGDFVEIEVKRWKENLKAKDIQPIPVMNRLTEWLLLHLPKHHRKTLLHGNFSLNNLVFDPETFNVRAVLGWSQFTIGDPLVDVAFLCISHYLPPTPTQQGFPSAQEIFELYSKEMGIENISNWQFYMAFVVFQQAAILQTNQGTASRSHSEDMANLAWDFATKEGFRIFNALPRAANI